MAILPAVVAAQIRRMAVGGTFPASQRHTFCCLYDLRAGGVGVQQFANLIYDDDGGDGFLVYQSTALARRSIPAVFLDHVSELDDVFAFLVLLARLEGVLIFPP